MRTSRSSKDSCLYLLFLGDGLNGIRDDLQRHNGNTQRNSKTQNIYGHSHGSQVNFACGKGGRKGFPAAISKGNEQNGLQHQGDDIQSALSGWFQICVKQIHGNVALIDLRKGKAKVGSGNIHKDANFAAAQNGMMEDI